MFPRLLDPEDHPLKGQELLNNLALYPGRFVCSTS